MKTINIAGKKVSENTAPLIIAELGINHEGSLNVAKNMAKLAVENGANIIKNQTHILDDEMSKEADEFKIKYLNKSIYSIMKENSLSREKEEKLKKYVENELNSIYLSTPFSRAAADFLMDIGIKFFKIGSGECNNLPLLKHIAKFNKPMILSTGMNNIKSIKKSVSLLNQYDVPLIIMHTTNSYPCPDQFVRLGCIQELKEAFNHRVLVGYSDHSVGEIASYGAVSMGACLIEKHFTDTFERTGPDIECSMDPKMCNEISKNINRIYSMKNTGKEILGIEKEVAKFAFASVCSIKDIKPGNTFSEENIWVKRPGTGDFPAELFEKILGKKSKNFIKANSQIKKNDLADY
jgi:N-acetylneuraminate synthase